MADEILALIPARSGSKTIPHKNIRPMAGVPLLAHSIRHAQAAQAVTRIVVSTDSEDYAAIAREYGAEAPFLRPAAIAGDHATDLQAFQHALRWLDANEDYRPDICVHLRPTHPYRDPADIDAMVAILQNDPALDAVRSVVEAPDPPFKMWFRRDDGTLSPVVECDLPEAYNQPRQVLPAAYLQNASIDVVRARVILEQHSMTGRKIHGYVMQDFVDVDTETQWRDAEQRLAARVPAAPRGKTYCFDIDGVIASLVESLEYDQADPIRETVDLINRLYDGGHKIILFTARGSATGRDWTEVTARQMREWGVRYHELRFGKPAADYYIDDKLVSVADLLREAEQDKDT